MNASNPIVLVILVAIAIAGLIRGGFNLGKGKRKEAIAYFACTAWVALMLYVALT